ncbi:MAG: ParB/Srx family N-terminal domain-containing protein [Mycoplasmatales bacterium]
MIDMNRLKDLNTKVTSVNIENAGIINLIEVVKIKTNEMSFYEVSDLKVDELAESIKANGQLEPLIVYQENDDFILISGHTRLRALQQLGKTKAKVVLVTKPENEQVEQLLVMEANNQRIKSKDERDEEIRLKHEYYTELKATNEKYKNINVAKLVAEETGVHKNTVLRAIKNEVPNETSIEENKTQVSNETSKKEKTLEDELNKLIIRHLKKGTTKDEIEEILLNILDDLKEREEQWKVKLLSTVRKPKLYTKWMQL